MSSECVVGGALLLNLHISRICGIAPINIVRRSDNVVISASRIMTVYGYIMIIIADAVIIKGLIVDFEMEASRIEQLRNKASHIIYIVAVVKSLIIITLATLIGEKRMTEIIGSLSKINAIQAKINRSPTKCSNEKFKSLGSVIWCLIGLALAVVDVHLFIFSNRDMDAFLLLPTMFLMIFFYCHYIITIILGMQVVFIAFHVHVVLRSINFHLNGLLKGKCVESTSLFQISKTCDTVRSLIHWYNESCREIRKVNQINGPVVVLMVVSLLLNILISFYYFIDFVVASKISMPSVVVQLAWMMYHVTNLAIIVEPGNDAEYEMAKTKVMLSKLLYRAVDPNLTFELELFRQVATLNNVSYSPMGTCVLSRPLIATILSCVTTLLVVALQYRP